MVITTPMIVYRHGDDVPGERIREILVYEDCISQPDRNVENPDNSDLLPAQSACAGQIELKRASRRGDDGSPGASVTGKWRRDASVPTGRQALATHRKKK